MTNLKYGWFLLLLHDSCIADTLAIHKSIFRNNTLETINNSTELTTEFTRLRFAVAMPDYKMNKLRSVEARIQTYFNGRVVPDSRGKIGLIGLWRRQKRADTLNIFFLFVIWKDHVVILKAIMRYTCTLVHYI